MTYYTKVFGCQMNQSDAERISSILEKLGIKESKADLPAEALAKAGLVIFVTCGVRQSAEDRVYGQINNIKKKNPKKIVVLTGCLAHRKDVQRRLKNKVDLFFSINDFKKFENWIIENCLEIKNLKLKIPARKNYHQSNNSYLSTNQKYSNKYTAFVPVMTGCNNFCAYCVVPYARGREYSRPAKDILKEVKSLAKKGYKEIILLGQNVNSYRSGRTNFPKLLKSIDAVPGKFWLTFLTSHPKDISDELIETIAKSKKICEYVSLPAQAGDNEIIRRMNRKYTIEHYKNLIKKIRAAYKKYKLGIQPSISTDIIVGFPGETKKQFGNTAKLLREVKYDMAYIAQYSPRPETAAWNMKDNISKAEKARREKVLNEILKKTALENNKQYIGKTVEILVDAEGRGHTRTQKKVAFSINKKIPVGKFAKVKITKVKAFGLEGEIK